LGLFALKLESSRLSSKTFIFGRRILAAVLLLCFESFSKGIGSLLDFFVKLFLLLPNGSSGYESGEGLKVYCDC